MGEGDQRKSPVADPIFQKLLKRVEEQKRRNMANPGLIRTLVDQRWEMSDEERATNYLDDVSISYQAQTSWKPGLTPRR